jgi:dTDP-4-amino-4,6-dideoxygalactose transaminase
MTFCATVNAIIHADAIPILADVDAVAMNIDLAQVEAKITSKTKAILPIHFAGLPCDMDALCEIARRHNLKLIEDCTHAFVIRWMWTVSCTATLELLILFCFSLTSKSFGNRHVNTERPQSLCMAGFRLIFS